MTNVAEWKFDRGGWLLTSDIGHQTSEIVSIDTSDPFFLCSCATVIRGEQRKALSNCYQLG
jgi:hypothetical protein